MEDMRKDRDNWQGSSAVSKNCAHNRLPIVRSNMKLAPEISSIDQTSVIRLIDIGEAGQAHYVYNFSFHK